MEPAHRLGRRGERAAARTLARRGYRILARNLRTPRGEVDLLAWHAGCLVVVEVKSGAPQRPTPLRVPWRQRRRLAAAGRWLARRATRRCRFRVDFVFVRVDGRHFVVTIRRDVLRRER